MKEIEFNINNHIRVQLTDVGRKALRDKYDELNEFANGALGEYEEPEEDAEGWSRWQMWVLMEGIGHKFGSGMNPPIYTSIKIEVDENKHKG